MADLIDRLLTLGALTAPILGGIAGAGQSADARRQAFEQTVYNRLQAARDAQLDYLTGRQGQAQRSAESFLANAPLGAEQRLVQQNAARANLIPALAAPPAPAGYGGVFNPFVGLSPESWGQTATAQAIADRRKALAALDPNFQFGSMAAYGLSGPGVASAEEQVAAAARSAAALRNEEERQMIALLTEQRRAADAANQAPAPAEAQSSKGGFWRTLGKIGLAAAPIAVGAINPGLGMAAKAALGGLSAAGQAALEGGSARGALTSGALGALTGGLAARTPAQTLVGTTSQRLQQAILNPRALATLTGAGLSGAPRQAVQLAAPFLSNRPFAGVVPTGPGGASLTAPIDMAPLRPRPVTIGGVTYTPEAVTQAPLPSRNLPVPTPTPVARAIRPAPPRRPMTLTPEEQAPIEQGPRVNLSGRAPAPSTRSGVAFQPRMLPIPSAARPAPMTEQELTDVINSPYFADLLAADPALGARIEAQQLAARRAAQQRDAALRARTRRALGKR